MDAQFWVFLGGLVLMVFAGAIFGGAIIDGLRDWGVSLIDRYPNSPFVVGLVFLFAGIVLSVLGLFWGELKWR